MKLQENLKLEGKFTLYAMPKTDFVKVSKKSRHVGKHKQYVKQEKEPVRHQNSVRAISKLIHNAIPPLKECVKC